MLFFSPEESHWIAIGVVWLEDDFGKRYCITSGKVEGIKVSIMDELGETVEQTTHVKAMHKTKL